MLSEVLQHGGEGGRQPKSIFSFGQPIHHLETSTDSKLINYTAMPSPLPSRAFVYFLWERSAKELHAENVCSVVRWAAGKHGLAALKHQLYSV